VEEKRREKKKNVTKYPIRLSEQVTQIASMEHADLLQKKKINKK
jgi:hypothetical protein